MPRLRSALSVTALVTALVAALAVAGSPAQGAARISVGTITLYAAQEFSAATVVVRNAKRVRVCISGKCKKALDSGNALWNVTPAGMPRLRKGQYRTVTVHASNASGANTTVTRRARVR